MMDLQKIFSNIGRIFHHNTVKGLAKHTADVGENVKGTLRKSGLEAGDTVEGLVHVIAPLFKFSTTLFNNFLITRQSGNGGFLGYGIGV